MSEQFYSNHNAVDFEKAIDILKSYSSTLFGQVVDIQDTFVQVASKLQSTKVGQLWNLKVDVEYALSLKGKLVTIRISKDSGITWEETSSSFKDSIENEYELFDLEFVAESELAEILVEVKKEDQSGSLTVNASRIRLERKWE